MQDQRNDIPGTDLTSTERNDIMGLRALLLNEIRTLNSKATKEQVEIAKVKSDLAQTIINSVKVEVLYLQAKVKSNSGFIPNELKTIENKTPE
jgi:hypothetical protein